MIDRRRCLALLGCSALGCSALGWSGLVSPAWAASPAKPFDRTSFDAALAAGGPVIVHVSAPWCAICKAQHPILAKLRDQPRFSDFQLFEIDFDGDKPSVRAVGARLQSTLIVYRGGREVARTVADREEGWIEELLEKALPGPAATQ